MKKLSFIFILLSNSVFGFSQGKPVKITSNTSEDFHASFSCDGKHILFDSEQSGHNEIYLYSILTKTTQQLTNGQFKSDHPTWFPDGRQILFTYWANGAERYKMNIDGSGRYRLFEHGYGIASPKGDKVACVTNKSGNYNMFIIDSDGNNIVQLTNDEGDEVGMNWSPDGNVIAYMCEKEKHFQLCKLNVDGSGYQQLTWENASVNSFQWSPDSKLIAYSDQTDSGHSLCLIKNDGTGKKELLKSKESINYISWSPDGQQILCSTGEETAEELGIVNIANGNLTKLTHNNARDTYPSWSPDGKMILFVSALDGDLDIYYTNYN
jgi:TolB protein